MIEGQSTAVLAIGGHAADMEFTCGAVIAKYTSEGHRAVLLHCTLGEKGNRRKAPQEYERQKRAEALEAARVLGAEVRILEYHDNGLPCNDAAAFAIATVIREVRPEIVVTHWKGSHHKDHRNAHLNTLDALAYAAHDGFPVEGVPHRVRAVYFAENWEDSLDFAPDLLVDVSDAFERWHEACSAYELFRGGISPFDFDGYYSALLRMRGCLARVRYAVGLKRRPSLHAGRVSRL